VVKTFCRPVNLSYEKPVKIVTNGRGDTAPFPLNLDNQTRSRVQHQLKRTKVNGSGIWYEQEYMWTLQWSLQSRPISVQVIHMCYCPGKKTVQQPSPVLYILPPFSTGAYLAWHYWVLGMSRCRYPVSVHTVQYGRSPVLHFSESSRASQACQSDVYRSQCRPNRAWQWDEDMACCLVSLHSVQYQGLPVLYYSRLLSRPTGPSQVRQSD